MKEFADKTAPLRDKLAAKYVSCARSATVPLQTRSHRQGDGRTRGARNEFAKERNDGGQGRQENQHQYISR